MSEHRIMDGAEGRVSDEAEYLTLREVARRLRFSTDTLRRHMIAGKLRDISWVDFLGNGKLRATRESVDAFISSRLAATEKIYSSSARNTRA